MTRVLGVLTKEAELMGDRPGLTPEVSIELLDEVFLFVFLPYPIVLGMIRVNGDKFFTVKRRDAADLVLGVEVDGDIDLRSGPCEDGQKEEEWKKDFDGL